MDEVIKVFKSKIIIFTIQILTLSLFIHFFDYKFKIDLDKDVSIERRNIIQFISNYIMFNDLSSLYFIYFIWFVVSLIPIFIFNDYKKAYSLNLKTFFFPNFFFYVFLYRYSPNYFNVNFQILFIQTILLGFFIAIFSLGLTSIIKIIRKPKKETIYENMLKIAERSRSKCTQCGTEFNSIPQYCYNCLNELLISDSNAEQ